MYHGPVRMVDDRASVRFSVAGGALCGIGSSMTWCLWLTVYIASGGPHQPDWGTSWTWAAWLRDVSAGYEVATLSIAVQFKAILGLDGNN